MYSGTTQACQKSWVAKGLCQLDGGTGGPESAAVTANSTSADVLAGRPVGAGADDADQGPMYCYRHPTTETWLRCGRCDQPICVKCSVQGPVGSRCRQCGVVRNDPLTSFTPRQLALGIGASVAAGAVAGFVGAYIGYFSILIGYFAGRFIADAVTRVIGYKRGPVMLGILFGGILLGTALGFTAQYATFVASLPAEGEPLLGVWLQGVLPGVLISAGAACFGAYQRLH
jgi:hypothetical protein